MTAFSRETRFSIAVVVCSWACFSGILFVPLWVSASIADLGISDALAGRFAATQHLAVALTSFGLIKLVARLPGRPLFLVGLACVFLANVLPVIYENVWLFALCRFLSGMGEGISLAVMHSLIAQHGKPDRHFAMMNLGVTVFAILAYPAVSPLIEAHGVAPVFLVAAGASVIGMLLTPWIGEAPDRPQRSLPEANVRLPAANRDGWLGLLALMVFFVGEGALWTYFSNIGLSKGLSFEEVGQIMSLALFAGLLATVVMRFLDVRIGRAIPLGLSLIGLCVVAMLFAYAESGLVFRYAAYLMYFVFLFTVTYSSGLLAAIDPSGSIVSAAPGARSVGNVLGPVLASFAVGVGHYKYLGWIALVFYVISFVLFMILAVKYDRQLFREKAAGSREAAAREPA